MSVWRRWPLSENPYVRTAFRVARVPPEVVRYSTIVQLIGRTRRIVSTDPQAHTVAGLPVTNAEINAAEQILLDPVQRMLEELLHHATEAPPLAELRQIDKAAAKAMAPQEAGPLCIRRFEVLQPCLYELIAHFLKDMPPARPSLGAREVGLVPPFGRMK